MTLSGLGRVLLGAGFLLAACAPSAVRTVGSAAPPFALPDAFGGELSLGSFLGERPVLLYFHMAYG